MPEPGTYKHQRRFSVRESPDHLCATFDLAIQSLQSVVAPDPDPVLGREGHKRQRLLKSRLNGLCRFAELHCSELFDHLLCFLPSGRFILLCVDRFQHLGNRADLLIRHGGEDVPVKVNGAALILGVGKNLTYRFHHTEGFISDDKLYTAETSGFQPDKEK